jgi:hypothetical protein
MALFLLAITNAVICALLYPLATCLNILLPSIYFGYASFYATGATNDVLKYTVAGNLYGAILGYLFIKLLPILGGGTPAWMILFFVMVFIIVMSVKIDILSRAYCCFFGAVGYFVTLFLAPKTWPATPEYVLLMLLVSLIIGWVAGIISINVPAMLQPKDADAS